MKADLHEIFDTASLLLESLGFPIFKPLVHKAATVEPEEENELWHIKGPSADATGVFSSDGFIVLKDSKAKLEFTPSMRDGAQIPIRDTGQRLYCQCWTLEDESDAMWKLYGRSSTGVCVTTSVNDLLF